MPKLNFKTVGLALVLQLHVVTLAMADPTKEAPKIEPIRARRTWVARGLAGACAAMLAFNGYIFFQLTQSYSPNENETSIVASVVERTGKQVIPLIETGTLAVFGIALAFEMSTFPRLGSTQRKLAEALARLPARVWKNFIFDGVVDMKSVIDALAAKEWINTDFGFFPSRYASARRPLLNYLREHPEERKLWIDLLTDTENVLKWAASTIVLSDFVAGYFVDGRSMPGASQLQFLSLVKQAISTIKSPLASWSE